MVNPTTPYKLYNSSPTSTHFYLKLLRPILLIVRAGSDTGILFAYMIRESRIVPK